MLQGLAALDEVAYIFPAADELVNGTPMKPCAGAITANGPSGQSIPTYGDGWDGPGLGAATLSYVFTHMSSKLDPAAAQSEILRAMAEWAKVVQVTWKAGIDPNGPRTVNILFAAGSHGDGFPFDGPNGVLAHTFYPAPPNPEPIAGDMHLDDAESWRIGANTDLFSVALHELGHALGLGHSDSPSAVMYPYYKMVTQLSAIDVSTAQTLYAAQGSTPMPPSVTPVTPSAAAPLTLKVAVPAATTTAAQINLSGSTSGGKGTIAITWSTDHGASGVAQGSSSAWTISGVPLVTGSNTITITATDSATHVAQSLVVTRQAAVGPGAGPRDTTPPSITITSPGTTSISTSAASIVFSGTASDNVGVTAITWSTNTGGSGTASGLTNWTTTAIPVYVGSNVVTIRASDAAGNVGWRTVTVTRR